ncbi:MAG: ATP-dependent Clp protease adapter ClpS [Deltaproteobacteria bacterium]|nr:ATP-dependent Clp protease adapter ClpS [Deltaproteobacteria bacterium]
MSLVKPDYEEMAISETEEEIKEPSMYKVLLHNDDYTSMEFVVEILLSVFNKSIEDATITMLKVHREGIGICGVYTYEVAETKVNAVHVLAREREFPLKCTMEQE